MRPYSATKDWHNILTFLIIAAGVFYGAAYKYLNPADFQWQNALYYGLLAVAWLCIYGHQQLVLRRIVEGSLAGGTTLHPAVQRASRDLDD